MQTRHNRHHRDRTSDRFSAKYGSGFWSFKGEKRAGATAFIARFPALRSAKKNRGHRWPRFSIAQGADYTRTRSIPPALARRT